MKMSSPTFNVLRFFPIKKKKTFLMFSSYTLTRWMSPAKGPGPFPHEETPVGLEMVRRDHPAIPGGAGDVGDGVLNLTLVRAPRLPLVAASHCPVLGAKLRAPTAFTAALA